MLQLDHAPIPNRQVRTDQTEPATMPPRPNRLHRQHFERPPRRQQPEQRSNIIATSLGIDLDTRFLNQHNLSCPTNHVD